VPTLSEIGTQVVIEALYLGSRPGTLPFVRWLGHHQHPVGPGIGSSPMQRFDFALQLPLDSTQLRLRGRADHAASFKEPLPPLACSKPRAFNAVRRPSVLGAARLIHTHLWSRTCCSPRLGPVTHFELPALALHTDDRRTQARQR
jgi:hypothetical protein